MLSVTLSSLYSQCLIKTDSYRLICADEVRYADSISSGTRLYISSRNAYVTSPRSIFNLVEGYGQYFIKVTNSANSQKVAIGRQWINRIDSTSGNKALIYIKDINVTFTTTESYSVVVDSAISCFQRAVSSGLATLSDGDYGDVVVSGSGLVMTVDKPDLGLHNLADGDFSVVADSTALSLTNTRRVSLTTKTIDGWLSRLLQENNQITLRTSSATKVSRIFVDTTGANFQFVNGANNASLRIGDSVAVRFNTSGSVGQVLTVTSVDGDGRLVINPKTGGSGTANCEQTLTKTSHGFRKWTPIYWNGSAWARPTFDSIIPTYIVIDSTTVNTFKVANCGNYSSDLTAGIYYYTGTSPGYTLTQPSIKTPLFEVAQSRLILQPLVGFQLASGSGDVTSAVLADTAAAIRADFPSAGITALTGDVTASGSGSVVATVANNAITSAKIASQTVDSLDVKNRSITTVKIEDSAITSSKVASQTIDSLDLKNRSITLLKVAPGSATNGQLPTFNSSTNTWSLSAGLKAINGYLEVDENGVAAEAFELRKRDRSLNIPVPTIRPKQSNQVIALDIMPNGTPASEYFDNGYAWIDVCSADVQNNTNNVYTARIGVRPSRVEFGEKKYGGDFKPLVWLFDTTAVHAYYPDGSWYLRPSSIYLQSPGTGTATQGLGLDANNKIVTTALGGGSGISALTGDVTASGSGSVTATIANDVVDSTNVTNASLSLNDLAQFGATSNQVLTWDNALSKWRPRTGSSITGTNNQTLRINSGGVPEASSVLTNDATNLVSTGRLTATGLSAINNATGATNGLVVRNQSVSGYSNVEFRDNSDNFVGYWGYGNASITPALLQGRMYIGGINKALVVTTDANTTASMFIGTDSKIGLSNSSPTSWLHTKAATTAGASVRIPTGTAPTSPNEGDLWQISNDLHFYTNSTDAILARVLKGSNTLDFGSTAAGAVTDLTITVTGAADGDVVSLSVPNASQTTTGSFSAWVSATNTVTVRYRIAALTGSEDPASGVFKVTVTK